MHGEYKVKFVVTLFTYIQDVEGSNIGQGIMHATCTVYITVLMIILTVFCK